MAKVTIENEPAEIVVSEEADQDVIVDDTTDVVVSESTPDPQIITDEQQSTVVTTERTTTIIESCQQGPPGPTGSGEITVEELDGDPTSGGITKLVFNGVTETVNIVGDTAYINLPTYNYSQFNDTDGTLPNTPSLSGVTDWYVSAPDSEGSPFKIGDWTAGTEHPATDGNAQIITDNKTRFEENDELTVIVYDADGVTILEQLSFNLTMNEVVTVGGITVTVSGWETDFDQRAATIVWDFDCDALLGSDSGRLKFAVTVSARPYTPDDIFYDLDTTDCEVNGAPTIAESTPVTRFLSGVEMYYLGSEFEVDIAQIDTPNQDAYRNANMVEIQGPDFGLPQLNLAPADLTGWTTLHDETGVSYNKDDWAITQANLFQFITDAMIRARGRDPWDDQSWVDSLGAYIIINTYASVSTRLYDGFRDEDWRLPIAAYDTPLGVNEGDWNGLWTSSIHLGAEDLQCWYSGGWQLYYPRFDYTPYDPNSGSQPDYFGATGRRYLYRAFYHNITNATQGSIRLHGLSKADLDVASGSGLRVEFKVPSKTGWLDLGTEFNNGTYAGVDGDGIWQNKSAQDDDWFDFGWKAADALDAATGWVAVVRISVPDIVTSLPTAVTCQYDLQEHA